MAVPDTDVVAGLRAVLHERVRVALDGDTACVLLDAPSHSNVGDSLILLGELAVLRTLGVRVRHLSDVRGADLPGLARRTPDDVVVLLHGGGNLGDLYPRHQAFREQALQALPGHRVVVLPQSVHFADPAARDAAVTRMAAHPDLTVLVRDPESVAELDGVPATLCPDAALAVTGLTRPPVRRDVLTLWRTDPEARELADQEVTSLDWPELDDPVFRATQLGRARRVDALTRDRSLPRLGARWANGRYEAVARHTVARGVAALDGRVLVTDRLHAHLLAVLLGIPHVVVDNSYGKLSRFCRAWGTDADATWASGRAEALALARTL